MSSDLPEKRPPPHLKAVRTDVTEPLPGLRLPTEDLPALRRAHKRVQSAFVDGVQVLPVRPATASVQIHHPKQETPMAATRRTRKKTTTSAEAPQAQETTPVQETPQPVAPSSGLSEPVTPRHKVTALMGVTDPNPLVEALMAQGLLSRMRPVGPDPEAATMVLDADAFWRRVLHIVSLLSQHNAEGALSGFEVSALGHAFVQAVRESRKAQHVAEKE